MTTTERRVAATLTILYLGAWAAFLATRQEFPEPKLSAPPPVLGPVRPGDPLEAWREMDADVLAGVAKGEDPDAGAAVMWVLLNRAQGGCVYVEALRPGQFGTTFSESGFRPSWWPGRRWTAPGDRAQLRRLRGLALRVLEGEVRDPTRGATHFHRVGTETPPWAPEPRRWRVLGSHAFYRESRPPVSL